MQTPAMAPTETSEVPWYRTRTAISGLFLVAITGLYLGLVLPYANSSTPQNYRFPFAFETNIYVIVVAILAIHFFYRLARPATLPTRKNPVGLSEILGMVLRSAFMLSIGGAYLTGALTATPTLFTPLASAPVISSIVGQNLLVFAENTHTIFAGLLVAFGVSIIVYEVLRMVFHKQTLGDWLGLGRYPMLKALYWITAILVIFQGILGMYLAGTFSSIGPYGLFPLNQYGFESVVRHIHGPMGAVLISAFYAALYFRVRPEFRIR